MTNLINFDWISIALADGWSAKVGEDDETPFLSVKPAEAQAALRFTPCDFSAVDYTAGEWIEMAARMNKAKGRSVSESRFNGFYGFECEFTSDDIRVHGWVLEHSDSPLDITYKCAVDLNSSYGKQVDSMIQSLRRLTNAEQNAARQALSCPDVKSQYNFNH